MSNIISLEVGDIIAWPSDRLKQALIRKQEKYEAGDVVSLFRLEAKLKYNDVEVTFNGRQSFGAGRVTNCKSYILAVY